jgi:hypothetical protein
MTVIGFSAASRIRDRHQQLLTDAGARYPAFSWAEIDCFLPSFLKLQSVLSHGGDGMNAVICERADETGV